MQEQWLEYAWYAVGVTLTLAWLLRQLKSPGAFADAPVRTHKLCAPDLFFLAIIFLTTLAAYTYYAADAITTENWIALNRANVLLAAGQIVLILLALGIASRRFEKGLTSFGLAFKNFPKLFARALLYFLAGTGMTFLTLFVTTLILDRFNREIPKHDFLQLLEQNPPQSTLLLLVLLPAVIAPITEELLFRGFLQSYFIKLITHWTRPAFLTDLDGVALAPDPAETPSEKTRWIAILITSALFAVMHPVYHWPALFVLSVFLGYAYEKQASLWPPIFMHVLFNVLPVTFTLLSANQ